MIQELSTAAVREMAKQAARSQAATPAGGQRKVPAVREDGHPDTSWALDDVLAHIDRADVVRWDTVGDQDVLVVRVRGDYTRWFALQRPIVVVDQAQESWAAMQDTRGPAPDPETLRKLDEVVTGRWAAASPLYPTPEAEHLADVHDRLHHGGGRTARAVPMLVRVGDWCVPSEQLQEMREWAAECPWRDLDPDDLLDEDLVPARIVVAGVEQHYRGTDGTDGVAGFLLDAGLRVELVRALRVQLQPSWEVDDAAGVPVYIGTDAGLAGELAHLIRGSHLVSPGVSA